MSLRFEKVREAGSMRYLVEEGDVVAWRPEPAADLRFGDLVVFQRAERVVLHRMVGGGRIKGDCVAGFDAWTAADQETGRVQAILRGNRTIYRFERRGWRSIVCAALSHAGGIVAGALGRRFYAPFRMLIGMIS